MSFPGLDAVDRPNDGLPVGYGILTGKSHGNDWTRAHEGSQAREVEFSILVCIKITALLWTKL